jgi:hypothetical protein
VRLLLRGLLVLLGGLGGLVGAEAVTLLLDPYGAASQNHNGDLYNRAVMEIDLSSARLFRHRPGLDLAFRGFDFHTDSRGFRGKERASPKPADTRRVLFVGDSVVLGWGVDEAETFVALVQDDLCARAGERWEAVNAGHLLHDTTQELAAFEEQGVNYEPDLVLLVYVDNDVVLTREVYERSLRGEDPSLAGGAASEEALRVKRRIERLEFLRGWLPSVHAVLSFLLVQTSPVAQTGAAAHAASIGLDLDRGWAASRDAIVALRDRCAGLGARFAVLDYYRGNELSERVERLCAEQSIPYASIAFAPEELASGVVNSRADTHANPRGHRILADKILLALDGFGWIPR